MLTVIAIGGTLLLIGAFLFVVRKSGKEAERLKQHENTIENISKANDVAADIARRSDDAVIIELRKNWQRK